MIRIKQLIFFISICILISCSHKNEFGQNRVNFNLKRIKPNTDNSVYNIIDTTKIYYEISIRDNVGNPVSIPDYKNNYLKFYKDGRVAEFDNINFQDIDSFNPKRADSYLYNLKNGNLVIQVYFKHPQCGQCFIKEKLTKISEDTFELRNDSYVSTYKAIEIPKSFLKYKPDW
ncbi:hypothetical protein FEDK69T_30220 [Flavobacterium enshiense DK69]|uniref:Lipoprotein n=1 Tax=Flavobacterium enshiense DK69 TaxID=1107311 RepID=V6S0M1_9FLAO|nr:hypothetical protein [Flavobacterium enshiense]ESU20208.1 hypothetical protein FEDK69T_30220 [Flavobacterium enshiense DK69]KGO92017.1 hypothetical protein Q767_15815 [Flavobacterium enshiense DK69]